MPVEPDVLSDEFSKELLHELRTPLQAISLAAELLYDHPDPGAQATVESLRAAIDHACAVLTSAEALIGPTRQLELQSMDLQACTSDAVNALAPLFAARSITVHTESGTGPHLVRADPVATSRILVNLLANAAKHSAAGSTVRVHLHGGPGSCSVRTSNHPGARPAEVPGWGIGLPLCHALAASQSGELTTTQDSGEISFTLTLPAA